MGGLGYPVSNPLNFSLNLAKHRNTKFALKCNRRLHERSPLLISSREIGSEYEVPILEVVKHKKEVTDDVHVHVR